MKKMLWEVRYLYQRKTTEYIIKRNFDDLVWQLNAAGNNKRVISNLNIKQPAVISGVTITHYFPNEFKADYVSHFFNRRGFTKSHLKGSIENMSAGQIKLMLKQIPAFEIVYLLLPILLLCSVGFSASSLVTNQHLHITSLILLLPIPCIIFINRKILNLLEKICIDYIRSGKEFTI